MADKLNSSASIIRPVYSPLGSPQIRSFQASTCAATSVIRAGDIVSNNTVVTTGTFRIVRAPTSGGGGSNQLEVLTQSLIGVALADDTSDGSTTGLGADGRHTGNRMIPVAIADGHTVFEGFPKTGGAAAAPAAMSSMIGNSYPVVYDSTLHRYFIDSTNSTVADNRVVVVDVPTHSIGDTGGAVYFKFLSTQVNRAISLPRTNQA